MKLSKTPFILAGICLLSFLIKTVPFFINGTVWGGNLPDSLYTYRLIELLDTFGYQPDVDYFTTFPEGSPITWGIVFTAICWVFWKLSILPFVPPVLFCGVIVAVYFIGKELVNSKVGLFSALIVALINGRMFYSAVFGGIDHHIGEILFSTLFILFYILAIKREKCVFIIPAIISGVLMTFIMPQTMIIPIIMCVGLVVAYFFKNINFKKLSMITSLMFLGMFVVLLPFTDFTKSLTEASCGSPIITLACAAGGLGCVVLYVFKHYNISKWIILALSIGLGVLFFITPSMSFYASQFIPETFSFINETSIYSPLTLITTLGLFTFFLIFGFLNYKKLNCLPFMIAWIALLAFITFCHNRWEYLLTVPLSVICALGIEYFPPKKKIISLLLIIAVIISAVSGVYLCGVLANNEVEDTWGHIGDWLQKNTPKQDYENNIPPEYGVLTYWEYGHYIEVWGHRATYSNPFQAHIDSERMLYTGENIPDNLKYIVIPDEMLNTSKYLTDAIFLGLGINHPKEETFAYKLYNSGKELYEYNGVKIFNNPNLLSA